MADFKIKSASGTGNKTLIQSENQSGSDYAIEVGSSGALGSLKPSSIKTTTNSYDAIKVAELNSLGYLNHNFFGCSYYLSSTMSIAHNSYVEITGTWSKAVSTTVAGSDDADIFGKFSGGRWTPTVSGYYFCSYSVYIPNIDDGEWLIGSIRKNGVASTSEIGLVRMLSSGGGADLSVSGAGIVPLDTNDYVSIFVYHSEGSAQNLGANTTQFSATYVGTSDL